jgi:site-specific DNA-methyltransferase (adenine-specific)
MGGILQQASTANTLFYGDNLDILQLHVSDESVDLVYLDPPFNSNRDYNVLFKEGGGKRESVAQVQAFEDTWRWDMAAAASYEQVVAEGGPVADAMEAFRTFLGPVKLLAYLSMMAPRLKELHRVLKPTGSIYLHCDPAASHYLKMLMDATFGPLSFRNEIIWRRTGAHGPRKSFGPIHDTLLFYTKSQGKDYYFNIVRRPYTRGHVATRYKEQPDGRLKFVTGGNILTGAGLRSGESGQPWHSFDPSAKGRHWAIPGDLAEQMPPEFQELGVLAKLDALYEAELIEIKPKAEWPHPVRYLKPGDGQPLQDIWASQPYTGKWGKDVVGTVYRSDEDIDYDVQWIGRRDPEALGFPTQKPEGLLERIIRTSCPEDGVVLDPFCGCGTAIAAAHKLRRRWIGIDITHLAVALMRHRLADAFGPEVARAYNVIGEPTSLPDAKALAHNDPYQFQAWTLGMVNARPKEVSVKKGADRGVDGRINFFDEKNSKVKKIIISVKAGKTGVAHVRDLVGTIKREKAQIGVLITMQQPTQPMRTEAADAGFYYSPGWGTKHPAIQLLTIEELLEGKGIDYAHHTAGTFKEARRARMGGEAHPQLDL